MTKYLIIAIGVMTSLLAASGWLLKGAYEDLAVAEQVNGDLELTIDSYKTRLKAVKKDLEERDLIVADLMNREQQAINAANVANRRLRDALKTSDCAAHPIPDDAARLLCSAEGHQGSKCKELRSDTDTASDADTKAGAWKLTYGEVVEWSLMLSDSIDSANRRLETARVFNRKNSEE